MQRIIVLNPKGGSGKTTLATNLAAYFASHGLKTALIDYDSQGSSSDWLERRPDSRPSIQGIAAFRQPHGVTRSFAMRTEPGTDMVITDTPAALDMIKFSAVLNQADAILIPVLPSEIDIRAATDCVAKLLTKMHLHKTELRIAVLANRAKTNTRVYQKLAAVLTSMSIPFIATLRDSQVYINSAEEGIGLFEMRRAGLAQDLESWQPVLEWLCSRGCDVPQGLDRGTQEALGQPKATELPKATEPPKATELPKVTEPPKATELPKVTEPPKATELPINESV